MLDPNIAFSTWSFFFLCFIHLCCDCCFCHYCFSFHSLIKLGSQNAAFVQRKKPSAFFRGCCSF
jgi:hypothetical protein